MGTEITVNPAAVSRLQSFFNDPAYREAIESASNYNAGLAAERTMRLPFLDSQTGVAQNHSNLWMDARQRLPGLREGQVYSYPAKRWRKKRRQYLLNFMQPRYPIREKPEEIDAHTITTVENSSFSTSSVPPLHNDDSKDSSSSLKDEVKQQSLSSKFEKEAWYYDDLDIPDAGEFDEPDADSDYDYEESYSKRKKKRGAPKSPRGGSATRGTKRKITYDPITDSEKPFACDLCGARYKTRPGLTYHYTHSHKDKEDEDEDEMIPSSPKRDEGRRHSRGPGVASLPPPVLHPQQQLGPIQLQPPTLQPQAPPPPHHLHMVGGGPLGGPGAPPSPSGSMMPPPMMHHPPPPHLIPQQQPPPHHMSTGPPPQITNHPLSGNGSPQPPPGTFMARTVIPPTAEELQRESGVKKGPDELKPRVQPSTYCDFCLGDAAENKKSGGPEELVSCSDCGRSGHPTCLQFTANMIISVKKYRWQCIECKCCSICGTSDNDDQLLFCDDCDRGYHMYCLAPPLDAPPEGSWSCTLCLDEFHKK
ncbi:unnamed protein product [Allacma fusca]|uniref:Zinc finger protein ubi-d4 n=1 Tax=Allacma fusca TaxID=39272 RepID=A0A8J2PM28_9HEXA|nr:unnamed protein product [Allacma fusca]